MCAAAAEQSNASSVGDLLIIVPIDKPAGGLRLVGEVDISNRGQLIAALEPYIGKTDDVFLELAELSFIDVGGVSVLMNVAERLSPSRLVLSHPPRVLRRIVELAWAQPTLLSMVGA